MPEGFGLPSLGRLPQLPSLFGRTMRPSDPLAPYGPRPEDVEAERQAQERDKGFSVWDILDIPTKALFGYAITGAMAPEEGETAWQGFNRGAPWSFLIDLFGLSEAIYGEKDYVRRKTMRDIRIAHGADPTEVDDGVGNFVLNTLGSIVLDPSSFVMPFGKIPGAAKAAVAGASRGMIAETVEVAGKGLTQVMRPAITVEEKVRTHMNGMLIFKVPWMDAGFDVLGWMPRNIQLWSAERLSKSADWLRRNPVTGGIYKTFNAATGGISNTFARHGVETAFAKGREARNAIYFEHIDRLKSLYKRLGHKFDADGHKLIIDALEHNIDALDEAADLGRKFEEGYSYHQNFERVRKIVQKDPDKYADLIAKADAGDGAAVLELYQMGHPQPPRRLKAFGLEVRQGIDVPGLPVSGPSLGEGIEKVGEGMAPLDPLGGVPTTAVGTASRRVPESAEILQAPRGGMPEDLVRQKALGERQARLRTVAEGGKPYTLGEIKSYALGLKGIYKDLAATEMRVGLLNDSLELYVPRQISEKARDVLHLEFKRLVQRKYGEKGLGIWAEHLNGRKFHDMSTLEVNLLLSDLGSKVTGYAPLEQLAELAGDPTFRKSLQKGGAREVLEFFNTDTVAITYRRLSEGARVVGRKAMLEHLLDPQNGVVEKITDSADLAGNLKILSEVGEDGHSLVPLISKSDGHGLSFMDRAEVIEGALIPHQRGRVLAAQQRYLGEIDDWITIDGARFATARDQLRAARDLTSAGDLSVVRQGNGTIGDLQVMVDKKNLLREQNEIRDEILRTKAGQPSPLPKGQRHFAQAADGTLVFRGDLTKLSPSMRSLVDTYIAESNLLHGATGDAALLRDLRAEANVALTEAVSDDLAVLMLRRKTNRDALREVDDSIKGMLDHEFFRHDTQIAAYRDVTGAGVKKGIADLRKRLAEGKGQDIVNELALFKNSDYMSGLKRLDPDELQNIAKFKSRKIHWVERETATGLMDAMKDLHAPDFFGRVGEVLDRFPNWWKRTTVVPWPQSRIRDIVSNVALLLMGGMKHGISATSDTFDLLGRHRKMLNEGLTESQAFAGAVYKAKDAAGNAVSYTGEQILTQLRQKGLLDSGYVADELMQSLDEQIRIYGPQSAKQRIGEWVNPLKALDLGTLVGGPTKSGPVKLGMRFSAGADNYTKVIGYFDALRRGMSPDEAAQHVKKFLWNPAHAHYSRVERYALRRALPFYNWTKFAVGLMTDQFMTHPGTITWLDKLQKTMRTNPAPAQLLDSEAKPVGDVGEDIIAARAIQERMAVPWRMGKHGPEYFLFDGYIPQAEIPQLANMFLGTVKTFANMLPGVDIQQGPDTSNAVSWWGERLTPFIKVPMEQALNRSFYAQRDIESFSGESSTFLGVTMTKRQQAVFEQVRLLRELNTLFRGQKASTLRADLDASKLEDPRSAATRFLTGGFGVLPRTRAVNLERSVARAETEAAIERGRLRARLRDNLETPDRDATDEENRQQIVHEMTRVQANILRIEDLRARFKLEKEKRRRNQPVILGSPAPGDTR